MIIEKNEYKKTEFNKKFACIHVVCNGWKECEERWCEAEWWCKFHPDYDPDLE